ncbi:MAG: glycosyltransferase [Gammaproteobacteria bacterium]|nr:glycosyltransferase [Gammaproteobacteria bacterium]
MRILLATFANRNSSSMGVGRYYNQIANILEKEGHELIFFNHPTPLRVDKTTLTQTLIPIFSGVTSKRFGEVFEAIKPDAVHIQSEVGLGISARNYCVKNAIPYSSAYHTNWDIGMKHWAHLPSSFIWSYLRWYYKPASVIYAGTPRVMQLLRDHDIQNPIETFPLGVDSKNFYYDPGHAFITQYKRPYFISLSRISKEKNIEAYLDLNLPGTKFLIGDGPYKKYLEKKYQGKVVFLPYENVRQILSLCDVFVFPSRYDTFGLTNLEALACGLPIAAYPVMGPVDIIKQGVSGYTSENLQEAALACLSLKKEDCIQAASQYTWERTAHEFLKHQIVLT